MPVPSEPPPVATTWDGKPIAEDEPTGSVVVVRRTGPGGEREALLLHRSASGVDFEGDWAWTAPAGCRQPGESVYPAALRELAEEAGLTGRAPWAVDLSGRWAVFAVDIPYDVEVSLVDPEHDRFEWLSAEEAADRVRPPHVAAQQCRAMRVRAAVIGFRAMTEADFGSVATWQSAPHVAPWWDAAHGRSAAEVAARYLPRLRGEVPVRMWIAEIDGRPAAMLQDYRVDHDDDYATKTGDPDAIGFDYLVGDETLTGIGIGTRLIWEFCRDVLHRDYPGARHFLASPSHRNVRSRRVLAKCGFSEGLWIDGPVDPTGSADTEVVCTLDVGHWLGERSLQPEDW